MHASVDWVRPVKSGTKYENQATSDDMTWLPCGFFPSLGDDRRHRGMISASLRVGRCQYPFARYVQSLSRRKASQRRLRCQDDGPLAWRAAFCGWLAPDCLGGPGPVTPRQGNKAVLYLPPRIPATAIVRFELPAF